MPELPEVERARKLAERIVRGQRIARVRCADDAIVFEGVSPTRFRRALVGQTVLAVHRRGKHLWFELDRRPWPLFHFGMTGGFHIPGVDALELASSPKIPDRSWPPRFTKIHLEFEDGRELAMTNARRLGRIRLRDDPEREPPISELGFDPLLALPSDEEFAARLDGRRVTLKGILLDQSFAAGVGNWIADEVLYQARLDPRRRTHELDPSERRRLRKKLGYVIDRAVAVDAQKSELPRSWLFHRRWGKDVDARTYRGEPIEHIRVAGRTTAWVPSRQK